MYTKFEDFIREAFKSKKQVRYFYAMSKGKLKKARKFKRMTKEFSDKTDWNNLKENILVPRNIDGRLEKAKQQAIKLLSQETIEGELKLEPYMLDIPDELIKVKTINGNFDCSELKIKKFPKWFERLTINGTFYCYGNKLTTLEGCPQIINGSFSCGKNKLKTLKGCPQIINGSFNCYGNNLTSLEGGPQTIKDSFDCSFNQLASLEGCPKTVNGYFSCSHNKVKLDRPENCKIKGRFIN